MASSRENAKKENLKYSGLKKCFAALVDRKQVNLDEDVLRLMLKYELSVNVDALDEHLSAVLPYMLVFYIRNWPGWQRSKEYYSGKLNFREWYEKFRQYIIVKQNFLIKSGYNLALDMLREERKKEFRPNVTYTEHSAQTDFLAPKGLAPFSVSIQCPPKLMSSLVFTDSGDHIVMRQHPELYWIKLGLAELIHWPHVGVEFVSTKLSFKRFNRGEYSRVINLTNNPLKPEKNSFIEEIKYINSKAGRECYTLNILQSYTKQYIDILKCVKDLSSKQLETIQIVIAEFLKDIEEIEMNNTMATNTSVLFNIGKWSFIRNKKISKAPSFSGSKTEVGYSETFIPKMETSLNYFQGVQDMSTPDVSFSYLNEIKSKIANDCPLSSIASALPWIVFICIFCDIKYDNDTDLQLHLKEQHKMEPNFMCPKCTKSFPMNNLAKIRWKHICPAVKSVPKGHVGVNN